MPLSQGAFNALDHNRGFALFMMRDGDREVQFAATYRLMDDIEHKRGAFVDRKKQFKRLRGDLEAVAQRRFSVLTDVGRDAALILLTSADRG